VQRQGWARNAEARDQYRRQRDGWGQWGTTSLRPSGRVVPSGVDLYGDDASTRMPSADPYGSGTGVGDEGLQWR
jgi:hypothetical protein